MTTKARLLHYYPNVSTANGTEDLTSTADDDDWCATHLDHGCLTGLTSAMYVDEGTEAAKLDPSHDSGVTGPSHMPVQSELPASDDPEAGLYIQERQGKISNVRIPRDQLAFHNAGYLVLVALLI